MTEAEAAANPRSVARSHLSPSVSAAYSIKRWTHSTADVQITALAEELISQVLDVMSGAMGRPEAMLTAQAHTLDAIFNSLASRAVLNFESGRESGGYSQTGDAYLRLAMRAQNQCRATLEALAMIKNPPGVAFVRQANIAHGLLGV